MSGTLGRDHYDVHIARRNDGFEMNAETVRESQNLSGMQIWLDVLLVNRRLGLVRGEHVNPVGALGGFIRSHHHHAIGASLLRARAVRFQPHNDLADASPEIYGLSVDRK